MDDRNSVVVPLTIYYCNQCPDCERIEYPVPGRRHAFGLEHKHICFNKEFFYPQVIAVDHLQPSIPSGCPRLSYKEIEEPKPKLPKVIKSGIPVSNISAFLSEMLYAKSK